MGLKKKTCRIELDNNDRYVLVQESKRKGSLDFEGTTKRRFALGDSIRTFRAGR